MKSWLRRVRGAIGMGLTWAVAWAFAGIMIGVSSILFPGLPWDLFFRVFDAPLPALAVPGFLGGLIFSIVLGVAARHRRFDELSLPRYIAWGALGGLLVALIPAALFSVGLATLAEGVHLWQMTAVFAVPLILLGSASAGGTLILARKAEDRDLLASGTDHVASLR